MIRSKSILLRALVAVGALVFALAFPLQAAAQADDPLTDPTAAQYENPGPAGDEVGVNGGGGGPGGDEVATGATGGDGGDEVLTSSAGGSLPFTGFDAGILAAVALLLGGVGVALKRLSTVH